MMLKLAVERKPEITHQDVSTAFLYGELAEHIYMKPPEGVNIDEGLVCELQRSIYGLKQSVRCWNANLTKVLKEMGFSQGTADQCLF